MDQEVKRMMDVALHLMQESIRKSPGEWLWQHNRWKQQTLHVLYKRFRHESICIILDEQEEFLPHLATLRSIYQGAFLSMLVPKALEGKVEGDEIIYYTTPKERLRSDYRFKLIFNLTQDPAIKPHYEKFSVFETLQIEDLRRLGGNGSWSEVFRKVLCRC
jgi:hypothetical protein